MRKSLFEIWREQGLSEDQIMEKMINEVQKTFGDVPSVEKHGEWYKVDTGSSKIPGQRRVAIWCQQAGLDMINKALEEEIRKDLGNKGNI